MQFDYQPNLTGELLELRPLRNDDFTALYAVASDPLIWQQHPVSNRWDETVFHSFFDESLASGGALIATDKKTNDIIGSSRYHGYNDMASEIEIGWTFLAKKYWGGAYNGEMKRLMLHHAFQYVQSVVLLVGQSNIRSQHSVKKVGGKHDGIRRNGSGLESYLYRIRRPEVNG